MHPRSSYLAAADEEESNREPLLAHEDYPVLLPDAEPSASASSTPSKDDPSAPPAKNGNGSDEKSKNSPSSVTPEKAEGYGLPTGYQAQYAEGPPDTQAMQAGAQTTRQPALPGLPPQQTNHRMQLLGSFDDTPAVVTCANCGVTGHTFVYKESGCCVYFSAISCLLLGCWPCMWMPFCVRPCKDSVHRCSNCGLVLGKHAFGR